MQQLMELPSINDQTDFKRMMFIYYQILSWTLHLRNIEENKKIEILWTF